MSTISLLWPVLARIEISSGVITEFSSTMSVSHARSFSSAAVKTNVSNFALSAWLGKVYKLLNMLA